MIQVVTNSGVGVVTAGIGVYGMVLAFVSICPELAQSGRIFSRWCEDLARGSISAPPAGFESTWFNAELTFLISSIFPVMLFGVGIWLCRGAVAEWRKDVAVDHEGRVTFDS